MKSFKTLKKVGYNYPSELQMAYEVMICLVFKQVLSQNEKTRRRKTGEVEQVKEDSGNVSSFYGDVCGMWSNSASMTVHVLHEIN